MTDTAPAGLDVQMQEALDRLADVHAEMLRPVDVTLALREAVADAAGHPDTWAAVIRGARAAATVSAGGRRLGPVRRWIGRAVVTLAVAAVVYSVGGWGALSRVLWPEDQQ